MEIVEFFRIVFFSLFSFLFQKMIFQTLEKVRKRLLLERIIRVNSFYSKTDLCIIKTDLMKTLWTFERSESIHSLNAAKPRTSLTKFEGDSIQHSIFENRKQHVASASVLLRNVCITSWTTTTSSLSSSSSIWISSSSSLYLVEKEPSENEKMQ